EFEGQGIGSILAKHVLDYAQTHHLKVRPLCPFIKAYIQRHPEYEPLVYHKEGH
ncbi:MAG: GNAT family N-acetyltransferase, partial [Runella zeae]